MTNTLPVFITYSVISDISGSYMKLNITQTFLPGRISVVSFTASSYDPAER